jgi:hypothetical protein
MKNFTKIVLPLLVILTQACVKDRVPNPSTLNTAQTSIYSNNFDTAAIMPPALPAGWVSAPSANGWVSDSSAANASNAPAIGYPGGSGGTNLEISNPTSGSGGTCTLTTSSISTLHYQNITLIWAARNSKHFGDNGSTISFSYSVDGGNTWEKVLYTENPFDSDWHLDNNGARIALGSDANNQPSVLVRWSANVVATASGSYRIDDFNVFGTSM